MSNRAKQPERSLVTGPLVEARSRRERGASVRLPRLSLATLCRRARATLIAAGRADVELSLLVRTDGPMQELNQRWRQEDRPTDVLSFAAAGEELFLPPGAPRPLGDVVINLDAVARQALEEVPQRLARLGVHVRAGQWGPLEEASFLIIHGILHLLGHDHATPEEEGRMVAEERRLMEIFLQPPWTRRR